MANFSYKVLGQSAPAATTETTLYTVPNSYSAVISTIAICNQAATPATFRIAVRPAADSTTAAKHWIVYGATLDGSDATMLSLGLSMAAGDKIQIYASSATMSFSAFGSEII
jgi:hypothetical protein